MEVRALNPQLIDSIPLQRLWTGATIEFTDTAVIKPSVVDDWIRHYMGVEKGTAAHEIMSPIMMFMQFPIAFQRKILKGQLLINDRQMGNQWISAQFLAAWAVTSMFSDI